MISIRMLMTVLKVKLLLKVVADHPGPYLICPGSKKITCPTAQPIAPKHSKKRSGTEQKCPNR